MTRAELKAGYSAIFGSMTKGVADIEKGVIALEAEMHADLETLLLEEGSKQESLWGFNLYPDKTGEGFIEYTSLINVRPHQNNKSMEIVSPEIREKVKKLIGSFII